MPADDTALVATEHASTALSVLHASEYVNGNGYYLYTEALEEKETCNNESNKTKVIRPIGGADEDYVIMSIWYWW